MTLPILEKVDTDFEFFPALRDVCESKEQRSLRQRNEQRLRDLKKYGLRTESAINCLVGTTRG